MYTYDRTESTNRSVGDTITSARLQDVNQELDELFTRIDDRNLTLTYDVDRRLTQIVDNTNAITVNIDRSEIALTPRKLYIQEVWNLSKFTITYSSSGVPSTILYA